MRKNFSIEQGVELVTDNAVWDLHNTYSLSSLIANPGGKMMLIFSELHGRDSMAIRCSETDYLEVSQDLFVLPSLFVDEVGYKAPSDHDDEWLMTEVQAASKDHMYFRFEDGGFLRFHCAACEIVVADVGEVAHWVMSFLVPR